MDVTAVLFGAHRAFLPPGADGHGSVTLHFTPSAVPVSAVVRALGMPVETARIVFLEGQPVGDDRMLEDGDTVVFVSPLGGG